MKLYYSPGACSLAPHIIANELGLKIETIRVDLRAHKTERGEDYYQISPKGSVPALIMEDGGLLTEGPAISQYLCAQKPGQKVMPESGERRFRTLEWLNFITSEVHKNFGALFSLKNEYSDEKVQAAVAETMKKRLASKFTVIEKALSAKGPYLTGSEFTPADAYLYVVSGWSKPCGVDLTAFPKLMGFIEAAQQRPAVQKARAEEGLAEK